MKQKLVSKMADFLQLERDFRAADSLQSLAFVATNMSHKLIAYDTAVLFLAPSDSQVAQAERIHTVSGTSSFEADAPALVALSELVQNLLTQDTAEIHQLGEDALLVCPLLCQHTRLGTLVLRRSTEFQQAETAMAEQLSQALAHALLLFRQQETLQRPGVFSWVHARLRRTRARYVFAALALLALLPVRQSVIAEGKIVAREPAVIASALNGVVKDIHVAPNQLVKAGELLLSMDATELVLRRSRVEQELTLAKERFRKAQQQSFRSEQSKSVFAELSAEVELKVIERNYVNELIERLEIRAPTDGVVMYSAKRDWVGRAVSTGEKIMELADERDRHFEIWVDVADAITLESGNSVKFFPDAFPLRAVRGAITSVSYFAAERAEQAMAYRITASLQVDDERVRLGMQGTARLYGERVLLAYYVLRKPFSSVRQFIGV